MGIDLDALWDHGNPELSEQRFREVIPTAASSDERLVLETQIARTYGIRGEFDRAREALAEIHPRLESANAEVNVRYWLELGRTFCSARHSAEVLTKEARQHAREAYVHAFGHAQSNGLDGLAVDALHMMTMVETSSEAQIEWNQKALAYMEASADPAAKKWEGSLRNNLGYALHLAGRFEEALTEFELSRLARQQSGNAQGEKVARWMIAWTLRAMGRLSDALEMQLSLEKQHSEDETDDCYVFQELEILYRELGDPATADRYKAKIPIN